MSATPTMTDGQMVKKFNIALYLNTGTKASPVWTRIKKSTDNTITMNPSTKDFDYIDQDKPTSEIDYYAPSLSQPITMYKGEADFEAVFDKFFSQAVGNDAHADILIIFYNSVSGSAYKAWKTDATLSFDNMNPVDSTITVNVVFAGTTDTGTVTVTDGTPVFTSTTEIEFVLTVTVTYDSTAQANATVIIGGVTKTTDSSGQATFTLISGNSYAVAAWDSTETYTASEALVADSGTTTLALTLAA